MDEFGVARERGRADPGCLVADAVEDVGRRIDQTAFGGVGHVTDQDQVAEPVEQIDGEPAGVVAGFHHLLDGAEQRGTVARGE